MWEVIQFVHLYETHGMIYTGEKLHPLYMWKVVHPVVFFETA